MEKEELKDLLERYVESRCTEQEKAWVEDWYNNHHLKANVPYTHQQIEADTEEVWHRLKVTKPLVYHNWLKYAGIAAALILAYLLLYVYFFKDSEKKQLPQRASMEQVLPGGDRATLTLANGQQISLTDVGNGVVATQANINIRKTADGQLEYTVLDSDTAGSSANVQLNTITTPKGGQYQVRLPDGSKVWLNAASAITYATNLSISKERVVKLSGEAYFEVATKLKEQSGKQKAEKVPFIVKTATQEIEVLGTHFNVSSYADEEKTITTLLEGSVHVSSSFRASGTTGNLTSDEVRLKPGQQSVNSKGNLMVQPADTELATAWKNGWMKFKSAKLPDIMRQVGRWYDIDIKYQGNVGNRTISGGMSRSSTLQSALQILEQAGVKFELVTDGKRKTLLVKAQ
ncbi:FecR family protein [Pedobacter sp. ASV28]|uniref:FecR family protein n=1 Tax=Pedobacter sp. ASV28 TaxID=2795123 RepID=UPI0018ED630F|nr:FecR domain-containing protein [Pedobacter sp. ASV28]